MCLSFQVPLIFAALSAGLTGRYPLKVKFCPLSPDDISAIIIDDGPEKGVTLILF